ncbi:MAG: hypothetical protein AAB851_00390, partial [Patescibacteria group bacterium]
MKKIIRKGEDGQPDIVAETDGTLWNFKTGDIIRQDGNPRFFYEVLGFRYGEQLWVKSTDEHITAILIKESIFYFEKPAGLILLSRPGMKFKVGDRVKASWKEIFAGQTGVVAAIDPTPTSVVPYLINFEHETEGGSTTEASWDKPWFPKSDKTLKKK